MNTQTDLIVIGGGATGAGIALDAALRGLSVVLLEQNDFGEGTSSRSTKLVHGGVRYLEAAVKHLNIDQWRLVREGLRERQYFLRNAHHLAHPIELITPLYRWHELPYVYAGLFLYDRISGKASLGKSKLLSASSALRKNRALDPAGLKGAVSYFDGAFNDARMVIALLQSAEAAGAGIHNYHQVTQVLKDTHGQIHGVEVHDKLNDTNVQFHATAIVNATGPFVDTIRRLDHPECKPLIETSSGAHIVLPAHFLPDSQGVMIPKTSDGRLIFALPWNGHCLVGTTDHPAPLSEHPAVNDAEIDFLLEHFNHYLAIKATRDDILSVFSGLRPLVASDSKHETATLVRESEYQFSPSGLFTVAGGKWTGYRAMAEQALDQLIMQWPALSHAHPCSTKNHQLLGSQTPREIVMSRLKQDQRLVRDAKRLYDLYGDRAPHVADYITDESEWAITHAEIRYTIHHEYVRKPLDFLVRRSGIGLTNQYKAEALLSRVVDIMARELQWDRSYIKTQQMEAEKRLATSI